MKFVKLLMLFLVLCALLVACSSNNNESRYTGVRADDEVVSSIRQEISDKENSLLANDNDVFWTESGKLWHKSVSCSYLANSKTIFHGSIEEARFEGKEKECERCFGSNLDSVYSALENNEYKTGDVFFTKDGTVWHTDINCPSILGADKIYFADVQTAKLLVKTDLCSECK